MRFFGKYSYAIFIFHWPVMMLTAGKWKTLSEPIFPNPMVRQLSFLIVSGGLTVGLSLMSWFLIEKRCLAMKRFFE
jgi:peptidoglycan/LPS O-acetylase OafA/YrhL